MPNRILKESICTSDDINELTSEQEVFFYRLIVNCDDYGRFDARTDIIRSRLYPLKTDKVKAKDIESWLQVLIDKEMVLVYMVEGKKYLQMTNWSKHQQIRAKKSKFPAPDNDCICSTTVDNSKDITCNQLKSDDCICPRESESEYENPNPNTNPNSGEIAEAYNQVCTSMPKVQQLSTKRKSAIKARLKEYSPDQILKVFQKAQESDFLSGRNGKWTGCNFDWIIAPSNFIKVLEGTYDNKEPTRLSTARAAPESKLDMIARLTGGDSFAESNAG